MEKSCCYSNNGSRSLDIVSDVKNIVQLLLTQLKQNPEKYANCAAGMYHEIAKNLLEQAEATNTYAKEASKHMSLARDTSVMAVNNPGLFRGGLNYELFCKRITHAIILLQKISTKPWLDIIEKNIGIAMKN